MSLVLSQDPRHACLMPVQHQQGGIFKAQVWVVLLLWAHPQFSLSWHTFACVKNKFIRFSVFSQQNVVQVVNSRSILTSLAVGLNGVCFILIFFSLTFACFSSFSLVSIVNIHKQMINLKETKKIVNHEKRTTRMTIQDRTHVDLVHYHHYACLFTNFIMSVFTALEVYFYWLGQCLAFENYQKTYQIMR